MIPNGLIMGLHEGDAATVSGTESDPWGVFTWAAALSV